MPPGSFYRARVAIVCGEWGNSSEEAEATRLVAGALATELDVDVIHLSRDADRPSRRPDSAFVLHSIPSPRASATAQALVRTALGRGGAVPDILDASLGVSAASLEALEALLDQLAPAAVVVCGEPLTLAPEVLRGGGRRVVVLPLSKSNARLFDPAVSRLLRGADLVLGAHPGEERHLAQLLSDTRAACEPLEIALSVNRTATVDTLFGVRFFQPFVLLIRSFPPGGARLSRTATHELVTAVAGELRRTDVPERSWRYVDEETPARLSLSVAEVDGETWRLADDSNMLPLPVAPNRVNLWRLMAHALFTIDLRPGTPLGRETLESFLFSTPVIVPDETAGMEHARAANGGLWYRDARELLSEVRVLTHRPLREHLANNARRYAESRHGELSSFVERICELVVPREPALFAR